MEFSVPYFRLFCVPLKTVDEPFQNFQIRSNPDKNTWSRQENFVLISGLCSYPSTIPYKSCSWGLQNMCSYPVCALIRCVLIRVRLYVNSRPTGKRRVIG